MQIYDIFSQKSQFSYAQLGISFDFLLEKMV